MSSLVACDFSTRRNPDVEYTLNNVIEVLMLVMTDFCGHCQALTGFSAFLETQKIDGKPVKVGGNDA
jgi:hypothetical protein